MLPLDTAINRSLPRGYSRRRYCCIGAGLELDERDVYMGGLSRTLCCRADGTRHRKTLRPAPTGRFTRTRKTDTTGSHGQWVTDVSTAPALLRARLAVICAFPELAVFVRMGRGLAYPLMIVILSAVSRVRRFMPFLFLCVPPHPWRTRRREGENRSAATVTMSAIVTLHDERWQQVRASGAVGTMKQ
jgi:hypothetical protein